MKNEHEFLLSIFLLFIVNSSEVDIRNLSNGQSASQTDTAPGGAAGLAVDGNTGSSAGCSQTVSDTASWELDLGDYYVIDRVKIFNYPYVPNPEVNQWVQSVTAFSSQWSNGNWNANSVIGVPNVYPNYGDLVGSWAQSVLDSHEFIQVRFAEALYVTGIDIYETWHGGGVKSILALEGGQWTSLYSTTTNLNIQTARIFSPALTKTGVFTNELRINVNNMASGGSWVEIDAINMRGRRNPEPPGILQNVQLYIGLSAQTYKMEGFQPGVAGDTLTFTMTETVVGRKLKIKRNPGDGALVLCEVKVFGYLPAEVLPLQMDFQVFPTHKNTGAMITSKDNIPSTRQCAGMCAKQLTPACRNAQYFKSSQVCKLYRTFSNGLNTNANSVMIIYSFACAPERRSTSCQPAEMADPCVGVGNAEDRLLI